MTPLSKLILTLGLLMVMGLSLSACNTMEGIGRDARAAGDALTGAARDNKGY